MESSNVWPSVFSELRPHRFTPDSLGRMEEVFAISPTPSRAVRLALAAEIRCTERQVQIWLPSFPSLPPWLARWLVDTSTRVEHPSVACVWCVRCRSGCRTNGSATREGRGATQAKTTNSRCLALPRTPTLCRVRVSCPCPAQIWRSSWRVWHRIAVSAPANSSPGLLPADAFSARRVPVGAHRLPALAVLWASDGWLLFCGFASNDVVGKTLMEVRYISGAALHARARVPAPLMTMRPPATQILSGPATERELVEELYLGCTQR